MIPPQQAGQSMNYDPLMTEFLTQGQMEHMPQAQYMTPQDYGAFRSMPGKQQMGAMPQQQMSMWQAFMIQNRGRMPFTGSQGTPYMFDTYNPAAEQTWYQTQASRRWQDAQMSMVAGAADVGVQMGGGAAVGAMAGGPAGLAAGLMIGEATAPITDRRRGMREIQSQSISQIMGGPDAAGGLGYGFSAPAAGRLDESIRRQSAGDLVFKQEDYRELLNQGMDKGLFDFDISEQQYEQKLKTLRDNVEVMQKLLGSTDFKKLTESMKKLMDMGMDPDMMGSATRMQAGFGFTAGRSIQQMTEAFGQPGAMAFNQAGLTPYQGSFQAMSSAANIEMAKRLGIYEPGEVARRGGVTGMAQSETHAKGRLMGGDFGDIALASTMDENMNVDPKKVEAFMSGDISFQEMSRRASRGIQRDPQEFMAEKDRNKEDFMDELGPRGLEVGLYHQASQIGGQANPDGTKQEQLYAGYKTMGFGDDVSQQMARRQSKEEFWEMKQEQAQTQRRQIERDRREKQAYYESPLRQATVGVREWMQSTYEDSFVADFMRGRRRDLEREERRDNRVYGGLYEQKELYNLDQGIEEVGPELDTDTRERIQGTLEAYGAGSQGSSGVEDIRNTLEEMGVKSFGRLNEEQKNDVLRDTLGIQDSEERREMLQDTEAMSDLNKISTLPFDADTRERLQSAMDLAGRGIGDIEPRRDVGQDADVGRSSILGALEPGATSDKLSQLEYAYEGIKGEKGGEELRSALKKYGIEGEDFKGIPAIKSKMKEMGVSSWEDLDDDQVNKLLKNTLGIEDSDTREGAMQDSDFMSAFYGVLGETKGIGKDFSRSVMKEGGERINEKYNKLSELTAEYEEEANERLDTLTSDADQRNDIKEYTLHQDQTEAFKFMTLAKGAIHGEDWGKDSEQYNKMVSSLEKLGVEDPKKIAEEARKGKVDSERLKEIANNVAGKDKEDIQGMMGKISTEKATEDPLQSIEQINKVRESYGEAAALEQVMGMRDRLQDSDLSIKKLYKTDEYDKLKEDIEDEKTLQHIEHAKKIKQAAGDDLSKEGFGLYMADAARRGGLTEDLQGEGEARQSGQQQEEYERLGSVIEESNNILSNLQDLIASGESDESIQKTLQKTNDTMEDVRNELNSYW